METEAPSHDEALSPPDQPNSVGFGCLGRDGNLKTGGGVVQARSQHLAAPGRCCLSPRDSSRPSPNAASSMPYSHPPQFDAARRVPATMSAIADAVRWAEEIMKAIDERRK